MSERIDTLTKLVNKCKELESVVDDDLKGYFRSFTSDAEFRLKTAQYHEDQNALSVQLLAAWGAYITPVTGLVALEARWNEDRSWYEISVSDDSNDDILLGWTFDEALKLITSQSKKLLQYSSKPQATLPHTGNG